MGGPGGQPACLAPSYGWFWAWQGWIWGSLAQPPEKAATAGRVHLCFLQQLKDNGQTLTM